MCFDNKIATLTSIWIIVIIVVNILSISIICILSNTNITLYIGLVFLMAILAFKFLTLRYFKMEITGGNFCTTYYTPFKNRGDMIVMEQPLDKINFCKLEKSIISHYICIVISRKEKNEMFCYEVGILSKKSIRQINEVFYTINRNT